MCWTEWFPYCLLGKSDCDVFNQCHKGYAGRHGALQPSPWGSAEESDAVKGLAGQTVSTRPIQAYPYQPGFVPSFHNRKNLSLYSLTTFADKHFLLP